MGKNRCRILLLALVCLTLPMASLAVRQQYPLTLHHSRVRTYYIAADEVSWDYAPTGRNDAMGRPFNAMENNYMARGPHRIGRVYKKVVYREYTDGRFATLKPRSVEDQYLGIVGPILHVEVGDTIKVFFKNNASRPYSIHPHGLLYLKSSEGAGYNDGASAKDREGDAVPPGATYVYVWGVPDLRVEYETREHQQARVDLELATQDYRAAGLADKAKAGFTIYAPRDEAARLRAAIRDPELTRGILSL